MIVSLSFLFFSCEEDVQVSGSNGDGDDKEKIEGAIVDYFYDLANESVDAKFLHYRKAEGQWTNTISDTTKIDVTADTINFKTYNNFRLKVKDTTEIQLYSQYVLFDETNGGECLSAEDDDLCVDIDFKNSQGDHYLIEKSAEPVFKRDGSEDVSDDNWQGFATTASGCISPENDGVDNDLDGKVDAEDPSEKGSPYACKELKQEDIVTIESNQFTSIEKIVWDRSSGRYKTILDTTFEHEDENGAVTQSKWQYDSEDIVLGVDTPEYNYDSLIYMVNINDFLSPDTGIFYLDTLEFVKTNFLYTSENIEIFKRFEFEGINIFSQDSMMFRVSTDCNQNGVFNDAAEEMLVDYNGDGDMVDVLDESDWSADGDNPSQVNYCGDDPNDLTDICYEFVDRVNGALDGAELFYDLNNNGKWDSLGTYGAEPFEDLNCNGRYDYSEFFDYNDDGDYDDVLIETAVCSANIGDQDICSLFVNQGDCNAIARCSDSQYSDKDSCEAEGVCSNAQYNNDYSACVLAGVCSGSDPDYDTDTQSSCESIGVCSGVNPNDPSDDSSDYTAQGSCESIGTCSDPEYTDKVACEFENETWNSFFTWTPSFSWISEDNIFESAGNIWTVCSWTLLDYCGGVDGLPDGEIDDQCTEWIDSGNGIWDYAEEDDGSGWGSKLTPVPESILFDYSQNPPKEVTEIDEFTEIENNQGKKYSPIEVVTILDSVYKFVPKVDSVVTIFSNEVITHFAPDSLKDLEYIITKTNTAIPSGLGYDINEYSYNIFNMEGNHVKELKNPSFFLPYGFYETPDAINDGFWFDNCRDTLDIFLWAENGFITTSDGDDYNVDDLIVNETLDCDGDGNLDNIGNGDYNIEIDYDVEYLDSVMVKTRKQLVNEDGLCLGGLLHPSLDSLVVSDPADCYDVNNGIGAAALDTIYTEGCFKVTKTMTMTYIGSGVEYGEKVTMWLAKDLGIVKNYLDIRWSEPVWVEGEQWKPYSRWELVELRGSGENDLARFANRRRISFDDFKDVSEFNGEPYQQRRTAGLHRIKIEH